MKDNDALQHTYLMLKFKDLLNQHPRRSTYILFIAQNLHARMFITLEIADKDETKKQ